MADVTPAGISAKLLSDLATMVAATAKWQSICSVATAAEALVFIHESEVPEDTDPERQIPQRPICVVEDDTGDRQYHRGSSTHSFGRSRLMFELDVPQQYLLDPKNARRWFMGEIETVLAQMIVLSLGNGGYRTLRPPYFGNRQGPFSARRAELDAGLGFYYMVAYDVFDGLLPASGQT